MIIINWMMSLILLVFMIYTNVPGNNFINIIHFDLKDLVKIEQALDKIFKILFFLHSGYIEGHNEGTRVLADLAIRKTIGIFIIALMNSFLISAVLQYFQVKVCSNLVLFYELS